jgi:hypothetical protein
MGGDRGCSSTCGSSLFRCNYLDILLLSIWACTRLIRAIRRFSRARVSGVWLNSRLGRFIREGCHSRRWQSSHPPLLSGLRGIVQTGKWSGFHAEGEPRSARVGPRWVCSRRTSAILKLLAPALSPFRVFFSQNGSRSKGKACSDPPEQLIGREKCSARAFRSVL